VRVVPSSGYFSNLFLGIAFVVAVFVVLWYLKLSAQNLKGGAKGDEGEAETAINEEGQGVAQ
jgi:hypothetical protein